MLCWFFPTLFSPNHFCFLLTTFVFSWTGKWVDSSWQMRSPNHFCFLLTTFVFSWTGKWVFQSRRKQKWLGENKVRGFQQALFTFLLNFFSGHVIGKSRKKPTKWYNYTLNILALIVHTTILCHILFLAQDGNFFWWSPLPECTYVWNWMNERFLHDCIHFELIHYTEIKLFS